MTKIQIASLSLKIVGIFSIIQAIPILKSLSEALEMRGLKIGDVPYDATYLLVGIFLSFSLLIIIGSFLIIFSQRLAKKIFRDSDDKPISSDVSAKDIQSIAFSVVGIVLMVITIPKLIQLGANLGTWKIAGVETKSSISISTWIYFIGIAVQFILGLLLFIGARGLSSFWYFLQKIRPLKNID